MACREAGSVADARIHPSSTTEPALPHCEAIAAPILETLQRQRTSAAGRSLAAAAVRHLLFCDAAVDAQKQAEAAVWLLGRICLDDPKAQCLLLCAKPRLRDVDLGQVALQACLTGGDADEALGRVHVKYLTPCGDDSAAKPGASVATDPAVGSWSGGMPAFERLPQLTQLAWSLQRLPFKPTVVAVLGLSELVTSQRRCSGDGGKNSYAWPMSGMAAARMADAHHLALTAALLTDAVAQIGAQRQQLEQGGVTAAVIFEDDREVAEVYEDVDGTVRIGPHLEVQRQQSACLPLEHEQVQPAPQALQDKLQEIENDMGSMPAPLWSCM
eukprot:TRINITY_DN15433_c0_g1_i3.p1 TRINITY_DN15433_c0_g1~~TRINITY_DN15433_c0_g1_i3.p1  ORF type:complete len:328 (+),score=76.28 TRINITY_DN15433_c0_g1_i3:84-1067(+)